MKTLFKAALLAVAFATPAFADPIPEADRAAITARVDAFDAAFKSGDMAAVFDYMPPKVLANLATQSGMTEETLMAAMKEQIDAAFETVTIEEFGMDVDTATWEMTPDGSRGYAMIPTFTVMTVEGAGKMRAEGDTLAFSDDDKWFLVRVDDPAQVQLLTAVYPEFSGVTFQPASITAVE
jgi:ketosteroid isomerase-like protein